MPFWPVEKLTKILKALSGLGRGVSQARWVLMGESLYF